MDVRSLGEKRTRADSSTPGTLHTRTSLSWCAHSTPLNSGSRPRHPGHRKWNATPSGVKAYQLRLLATKHKTPRTPEQLTDEAHPTWPVSIGAPIGKSLRHLCFVVWPFLAIRDLYHICFHVPPRRSGMIRSDFEKPSKIIWPDIV